MDGASPRIGLIGAGFISDYHAAGLRAAGGVVAAICAQTEQSARAKATRHGIPRALTDPYEIIDDDGIDAVIIATPDDTHEPLATAALRRGKAVMVQKPMARSVEEGARMLTVARTHGALLCVSFMHRYFPEISAIHELLSHEDLGEVFMVRLRNATPGADWSTWQYQRERVGGGVVMQLGTHGIDLLRRLFGEIVSVQAMTRQVIRERRMGNGRVVIPDNEDMAIATYRFESGLIASHEMTVAEVAGTDRFRIELYGTRGVAWGRTELGLLATRRVGEHDWTTHAIADEPFGQRHHRHFLDMARGAEPDDHSAEDGLSGLRIVEAIYRSVRSGHWEEVDQA